MTWRGNRDWGIAQSLENRVSGSHRVAIRSALRVAHPPDPVCVYVCWGTCSLVRSEAPRTSLYIDCVQRDHAFLILVR